jgi:uncharacterized RDD family membrane protein YckC
VPYDDILTISTPEGVELHLLLAGAASRFVSAIVDILIQIVLLLCVALILASVSSTDLGQSGGIAALIWAVISFGVVTSYDVFFEVLNSGRTPGKMLNGLRVVRVGGHPVTFLTSAIRNSLRVLDFLPTTYLLGAIVILSTRKNQRIGDVVAGTLVVREVTPAPVAPVAVPAASYSQPTPFGTWDTSKITREEIGAVRQFLSRRDSIEWKARFQIAETMADRLAPKVAGAPPELRGERFLEALVAAKARQS